MIAIKTKFPIEITLLNAIKFLYTLSTSYKISLPGIGPSKLSFHTFRIVFEYLPLILLGLLLSSNIRHKLYFLPVYFIRDVSLSRFITFLNRCTCLVCEQYVRHLNIPYLNPLGPATRFHS